MSDFWYWILLAFSFGGYVGNRTKAWADRRLKELEKHDE